jgi:AraC-like DNA-binding protein
LALGACKPASQQREPGSLLLRLVPGQLSAVDSVTGIEAWKVSVPPSPMVVGPDARLRETRMATGAGRIVLELADGSLRVYRERDGSLLGELPPLGRVVTDVVVARTMIYAAIEEFPGSAYVAAIDADGRTIWKRQASYSVARLVAEDGSDPRLLYMLDGNGRIWTLDGATGAIRARVIVPPERLAAFDLPQSGAPKALAPFLRVELAERAGQANVMCHPRALAWVDGEDRVVWTRELPARMRARAWESCDESEVVTYERRPRFAGLGPFGRLENVNGATVVDDGAGVLVLRESDGAVLLDLPAPSASQTALFFDSGTFDLDGEPQCDGPAPRARVLARCGTSLVYFNGTTAFEVDTRDWHVAATGTVGGIVNRNGGPAADVEGSVRLGDAPSGSGASSSCARLGASMRARAKDDRVLLPAIYTAHLVELVGRWGVTPEAILEGTRLTLADLAEPDARIEEPVAQHVVSRALELTREPGLGFYHGLQVRLSAHGSLGLAAMTASTFGEALALAERYFHLRGQLLALSSRAEGSDMLVELAELRPLGPLRVFMLESMITGLVQVARSLLGRPMIGRIEVAYPEPAHFQGFAHLWPGPARFKSHRNLLAFPRTLLDEALPMADTFASQRAIAECERELATLGETSTLLASMRRQMARHPKGFPTLTDLAERRRVSTRTLKRQLAARGTSFQALLDELRRDRAVTLLEESDASIDAIAERLGYSDASNFARAFRRWTGLGPTDWRLRRE